MAPTAWNGLYEHERRHHSHREIGHDSADANGLFASPPRQETKHDRQNQQDDNGRPQGPKPHEIADGPRNDHEGHADAAGRPNDLRPIKAMKSDDWVLVGVQVGDLLDRRTSRRLEISALGVCHR